MAGEAWCRRIVWGLWGAFLLLGGAEKAWAEVVILHPAGPALIPLAGLLSGEVSGDISVQLSIWRTQEEALGRLQRGEAHFAVLPVPLGAILAARSDLVLLAVHEWRVFSLVIPSGMSFDGWRSLVGKTLYLAQGRGTMLDALVRLLINREGLLPDKDIRLLYTSPQEIVALFRQGAIEAAALPEPFTSLCLPQGKGRVALDLQEAWFQATGNHVPVAGLFVHRDRIRDALEEILSVCNLFAASTVWSTTHPRESCETIGKMFDMPSQVLRQGWHRMEFQWKSAGVCSQDVAVFLKTLHHAFPEDFPAVPEHMFFVP